MTSIELLRQAIAHTEQKIQERINELKGCCDCPQCLGKEFEGLRSKLERQEAWLAVLLARKAGDQLALKQAGDRYAELTRESK